MGFNIGILRSFLEITIVGKSWPAAPGFWTKWMQRKLTLFNREKPSEGLKRTQRVAIASLCGALCSLSAWKRTFKAFEELAHSFPEFFL